MFLTKDNNIKWKFLGGAIALVLLFCGLGVFWLDRPLLELFRNFDFAGWKIFDILFSFKMWIIVSGFIFAVTFAMRRIRRKAGKWYSVELQILLNTARMVFLSVLIAGIVTGALKILIGRVRPVLWEALGQTGFYPLHKEWVFNSMPSGHTAASFAGLVMIGLLFPRIKWVTWTLAVVIGISRICMGEHWPTDVLLGAFIGMAAAELIKFAYAKLINSARVTRALRAE